MVLAKVDGSPWVCQYTICGWWLSFLIRKEMCFVLTELFSPSDYKLLGSSLSLGLSFRCTSSNWQNLWNIKFDWGKKMWIRIIGDWAWASTFTSLSLWAAYSFWNKLIWTSWLKMLETCCLRALEVRAQNGLYCTKIRVLRGCVPSRSSRGDSDFCFFACLLAFSRFGTHLHSLVLWPLPPWHLQSQ